MTLRTTELEHEHEGFSHRHELDDGLVVGYGRLLNENQGDHAVPEHTRYNLFHMSVTCDCGYRGEIDTYGEYGFWWKWFLHAHVHDGHGYTVRGEPVSIEMVT